MDDALDITGDDDPLRRMLLEEAMSRSVPVEPDPHARVFAEMYREGVQRRWEEFEQAMRDEGVPTEMAQRLMNRVQTGHPDGLMGVVHDLKGDRRG